MNNFHKFIIKNKKIIIDGLIFIGIYISISYLSKPIREGANMPADIKISHLDDLLFQLDNWDKRNKNLEDGKKGKFHCFHRLHFSLDTNHFSTTFCTGIVGWGPSGHVIQYPE